MGQGYTRNDTPNNIANGNVITAADLDGEFDAIVASFNETTGHTHDGTAAEGGAVSVIGPVQEYLGDGTAFYPKTTAVYTLGTASNVWANLHLVTLTLSGTATMATVDINAGNIDGTTIGGTTPAAGTFTTAYADLYRAPIGSNTAPIYSFSTDTDTGMYRVGVNTLGFSAGGTATARIDTNGFNGVIGGTTPAASKFTTVGVSDGTLVDEGGAYTVQVQRTGSNILKLAAGATSTSYLALGTTSDTLTTGLSVSNADGALRFRTGNADRMRIDSSGNVGIGAAAPSSNVHISDSEITAYNGSATDGQLGIGSTVFVEQTGGSNNALSQIVFQPRTGQPYNRIVNSGGSTPYMAFGINNAERMRIDDSGALIVGEVSTGAVVNSTGGTGAYISADGQLVVSNVSNRSIFNRKTTDGDIIEFRKDGTTVGSIGTRYDDLMLGTATTGLRFYDQFNAVTPWNMTTNDTRDGVISLGQSGDRFKDLHLSNNALVGGNVGIGTVSPNHPLDLNQTIASGGVVARIRNADAAQATTYAQLKLETGLNSASISAYSGPSGVGYLAFGNEGTEAARINAGAFLVGTTTTVPGIGNSVTGISLNINNIAVSRAGASSFSLNRTTTIGTCADFRYNGTTVGSISVNASNTTYLTSSDHRLKENVTPIQGAGDIVKAMRPVTYTFKSDGAWMDGFLAHELQELHPVAVVGSKDAMKDEEYEVTPAVEATFDAEGVELTPAEDAVMGTRSVPDYQGVDYSKLTPILTAALQEALNKIDTLTARIEALEALQ